MKQFKRFVSMALAAGMTLSMLVLPASAKTFTDMKGHWAEEVVYQAVNHGYVDGYDDNTFQPNKPITRAEFCKMLNSALQLSATANIDFSDVTTANWYYKDVQKAVAAGYISGYDNGTFLGGNRITRQEAALVIARIIADPTTLKDISALKDSASIAAWAKTGAVNVYSKGYMSGDNLKKFNPTGNLTRAEAVKIIEGILTGESIVTANVNITEAGQSYSDKVFVGNVIVSSSVGDGSVTFKNCKILGTLLVNGGGSSGIRLSNTGVANLTVNSATEVGVAAVGSSTVYNTYISTPCALTESQLTGLGAGFKKVTLGGNNLTSADVTLSGDYEVVSVGAKSSLELASGTITDLTIGSGAAGSAVALAGGTTVQEATINASCAFTGTGTIEEAVEKASGVTYFKQPNKINGSATTQEALGLSIIPKNGTTKVPSDTEILLTFDDVIETDEGGTPTKSYLKEHVVLRKGGPSGEIVDYTAGISQSGKILTIFPTGGLAEAQTYHLTVAADAFYNADGKANEAQTVVFYTEGASAADLLAQADPASGSTIELDQEFVFTFDAAMYDDNGDNLTDSYLAGDAFTIRKGTASGTKVSFWAEISSDKKTITLTPDEPLTPATNYYISIAEDSMMNSDWEYVPAQTFTYTTKAAASVTGTFTPDASSPISGKTGVDPEATILLTYGEALLDANGGTLTADDVEAVVSIRKGTLSGTKVAYSAAVATTKKMITLAPDNDLAANTKYFVILNEGAFKTADGKASARYVLTFTTAGITDGMTPIATYPEDQDFGIEPEPEIEIEFEEAVFKADGANVTSAYLEDIFSIRKNSKTGTAVSFDAGYNTARDTIYLMPAQLTAGATYYVVLEEGTLAYEDGTLNEGYSFSFDVNGTSENALPSSVSPANGSKNVATNLSAVKLTFDSKVYRNASGSSLNASQVEEKVRIRVGSNSSSASTIGFDASVASTGKTVTLTLSEQLATNKKYYIYIPADTFFTSDGSGNSSISYSFTTASTAAIAAPEMVPADDSTGVELGKTIKLTYDDSLRTASGSENISTAYLLSVINVRRGSSTGDSVALASASITNNKVITLTLEETMDYDTTYYVLIENEAFKTTDGAVSSAASLSFSTEEPELTVEALADKTSAEVNVGYDFTYADTATLKVTYKTGSTTKTLIEGFTPNNVKGSKSFDLTGLKEGTSYTVTAVLTYNDGKTVTATESFTTEKTATVSTLKSLQVVAKDGTFNATLGTVSSSKAKATVGGSVKPNGEVVGIKAVTTSELATMTINGVQVESGAVCNLTVSADQNTVTVPIVVTAESGSKTTYTLTFTLDWSAEN